MTPVARAKEVSPAGERERALLQMVEEKFDHNVAAFSRRVAERTGRSATTEKSSFYRIVRGESGRMVPVRLGHYAHVLGVPVKTFLKAWEEGEAAADASVLPLRLSPREVRNALVLLLDQVAHLERQVEALERQQQPRTRRAVKR